MVEDKYMDLVVTYGEPLITGNSSVLWKTPTLKIKFSYGTGDNSTPFAAATYQYYYYSIAYEYIASTQTQSKQQRPISSGTENNTPRRVAVLLLPQMALSSLISML